MESHLAVRPATTEAETIDRLLRLAEIADIPVIVVHPTCWGGCDVTMGTRRRSQKIYAETYPQYLFMNNGLYGLIGTEGVKYVCAPSLGKLEDP